MASDKNITVIQCTSCQTKFAVETAAILASEKARFHCSRCDNVFSIDTKPAELKPEPKLEIKSEKIEAKKQPQFTFDWNQTKITETEDSFSMEAPDFGVSVMNDLTNDPLAPVSDDELGKELFAGLDESALNAAPVEPMGYGSLARTSARDFTTDWDPNETATPLTPTAPGAARPAPRIQTAWQGLFTITAPIVAYTALMGLVCILSFSNPKTVLALVDGLSSGQETAAPPELYITDSAVKKVVLETGESVNVISGKIINDSQQNFAEVLVEGILFDTKGEIVAKKKINAASSLGKSRLQSLSLQMIDDLQNTKPAKRFELKAGQEYDFTMAVPEELDAKAVEAAFFSSRVYSVREL